MKGIKAIGGFLASKASQLPGLAGLAGHVASEKLHSSEMKSHTKKAVHHALEEERKRHQEAIDRVHGRE